MDQVVSGRLSPGSTFPSELELGARYGVSRTVVRESMRSLEEKGLVEIRQGQGTTVAPFERWNLLDPIVLEAAIRDDESLAILDDLVVVRDLLESQMAADAALRITDEELTELKNMLEKLAQELRDAERYTADDVVFHDIIMTASRNALAKCVVNAVHVRARASGRYTGPMVTMGLNETHSDHIEIYDRLAAHDAEGARAVMHSHIVRSWNRRRVPGPRGPVVDR